MQKSFPLRFVCALCVSENTNFSQRRKDAKKKTQKNVGCALRTSLRPFYNLRVGRRSMNDCGERKIPRRGAEKCREKI